MKSFFFVSIICLLASMISMQASGQSPVKSYDSQWKKVESFIAKGLPQSALTEVRNIYQLAKKENQQAQLIKATLYMADLQNETREDHVAQDIAEIQKEIKELPEPARSIMVSLLAGTYHQYYQNSRWKLYQRTRTDAFKKDDLATWGTEDFHKKISELYLRSIQNEDLLKQTKPDAFDAIITEGNMRKLRPTLYDLLAFRALAYFSSNERDIKKPAYAFEINTASAFDPAADFIHRKFETKDTSSLEYKALLIYQKLIAFHLNDKQPDALIDADIHRIQFVNQKSVHPDKSLLYYNTINHLAHQYATTPAAAQAWYLTAEWYQQKGSEYDIHGDTTSRYEKLKAIQICEKVIKENPNTEGGVNASNLVNIIKQKSLLFSAETVNAPGQPFRVSVNYGNIDKLHLRLISATDAVRKNFKNIYDNNFRSKLLAAPALRTWQQNLPDTKDFQKHEVEIKVDALPLGTYFLIAATDANLNDPNTLIGARLLYVSDISYINKENSFFILNRTTGQPLPKAAVSVWNQEYDYKASNYNKVLSGKYITDENGHFKKEVGPADSRFGSYQLEITYRQDRLFQDETLSGRYFYSETETKNKTRIFLFTDRSIYRPGQTVFFKGLATGQNGVLSLTDTKMNIALKNANGEEVSKMELPVNDYGTFSGKFQIPQEGLNGTFTIVTNNNQTFHTFRVEEYKRPKFYVEYEPVKKPYMVNDEITITGTALAYAGNAIDGATVKYRVVRTPRFIYPWFYKGWLPVIDPMEITHGETATDKDGKFKVVFTAIPDLKVSKKTDPVFDYRIYADVTDLNGETRSGEKSVSVSYKSILLKLDLPETLPADSLKSLAIRTENTNGEFEPAQVSVKITRLKPEQRLIRPCYWQRPDQFVMSKAEYILSFPNDEYNNETDKRTWEKESLVLEKNGAVESGKNFDIKNKAAYLPGFYEIQILAKDKNNEEVKLVSYVELTDESSRLTRPQYLWTQGSKPIEPGEKTSVRIGSSADNLFLINGLTKSKTAGSGESFSFTKLSQEKRTIGLTATEADRGGYGVSYMFVKHNRFFQYNEVVQVPWTNKDLGIEYASFREKTQPGSQEKWKIKITGYKKEKVAAEMLASMYDASLDQFYPHVWSKPALWPVFSSRNIWNGRGNFVSQFAEILHQSGSQYKSFEKRYDELRQPSYSLGLGGRGDEMVMRKSLGVSKASVVEAAPMSMQDVKEAVVANKSLEVKKDEEIPESAERNIVNTETPLRTNFNETAFFFPHLQTNENGEIEFSFTLPDALTRWKFQALAHTKELALGYSSQEIITQKDLMVQPNAPRFLREGDNIEFTSKIVNLTDKEFSGEVTFQLFDTETNTNVDVPFKNTTKSLPFTVMAKQSTVVKFKIQIPANFSKMLTWRIVAKAGNVSDGEENMLPVIPNRMLVTETLPLNMRGKGTKSFKFNKLINSARSKTLTSQSLTLEYTSNPAWYAIQALPYLMEYPYDCAEQTWNRYYANTLGAHIAGSSPRIAKVFETWRTEDTTALLSNLQKNQELKSVLLEETPWVLDAKSESQQKRNVALLFDLIRMQKERGTDLEKLKQMQSSNGGFVWFKGGPDDRYITQYIVSGIGHLKKLKAISADQDKALKPVLDAAIQYLDRKIKEDYDELVKQKTNLKQFIPGSTSIQYLYARSFFPDYKIADASLKAITYYSSRSRATWISQNKYMQGMIALTAHRAKDATIPKAILKSLSQTAIRHEELGMYWKGTQSWWWHENTIERQALLIEAFMEAGNDINTADELRTWLLKNKQTNRWESTKATAEACYALLLQGTEWLEANPKVSVQLGDMTINSGEEKQQAGTGYFKKTIESDKITASSGNIQVNVATSAGNPANSWGAVYWQYFEDLDKITFAETPLKLEKKLFLEQNSDTGPVLVPINEGTLVSIGDKVKVRIVLRVDREMEYVHMKDMRASSFEPVNVLSGYKWQGGLGYYETTKDASTNFFFNYLRKGTYVFEYPLFVTHAGDFSNGITTIQCMYAPEFTAHSEGVRVKVSTK